MCDEVHTSFDKMDFGKVDKSFMVFLFIFFSAFIVFLNSVLYNY